MRTIAYTYDEKDPTNKDYVIACLTCVRCKTAWLDRQYDTYPSDDGKWEIEND